MSTVYEFKQNEQTLAFIKHFELDPDPEMDSDGVWIPGLLDAILVLDLDPQKTSLVWRAQYR